jgi:hypothetical protein
MLFKRKDSFFLDLGSNQQQGVVAPPVKPARAKAQPAERVQPAASSTPIAVSASSQPTATTSQGAPQLTTAEAIAAELRATQAARPTAPSATFAPDCLNPANALPQRRRRAGANLAGFKAMAAEMFRS